MAPQSKIKLGDRFGRLLVIERLPSRSGKTIWKCQCDCGNQSEHQSANMTNGNVTSCGCFKLEQISRAKKLHGHGSPGKNSPTYNSWRSMKDRCSGSSRHNWMNYGGKGIKVCERWETSFVNFLADMGERPEGKTLDRIDSRLDYSPENCRWATAEEQSANRPSRRVRRKRAA